jgi:hypothetical protein
MTPAARASATNAIKASQFGRALRPRKLVELSMGILT